MTISSQSVAVVANTDRRYLHHQLGWLLQYQPGWRLHHPTAGGTCENLPADAAANAGGGGTSLIPMHEPALDRPSGGRAVLSSPGNRRADRSTSRRRSHDGACVETFGDLIAPMSVEDFFASYWEKTFLHLQNEPGRYSGFFSLRDIDGWLSIDARQLLITAPEDAEPRTDTYHPQEISLSIAYAAFARGCSLIFDRLEDRPSLQGLAAGLARDFHADIERGGLPDSPAGEGASHPRRRLRSAHPATGGRGDLAASTSSLCCSSTLAKEELQISSRMVRSHQDAGARRSLPQAGRPAVHSTRNALSGRRPQEYEPPPEHQDHAAAVDGLPEGRRRVRRAPRPRSCAGPSRPASSTTRRSASACGTTSRGS